LGTALPPAASRRCNPGSAACPSAWLGTSCLASPPHGPLRRASPSAHPSRLRSRCAHGGLSRTGLQLGLPSRIGTQGAATGCTAARSHRTTWPHTAHARARARRGGGRSSPTERTLPGWWRGGAGGKRRRLRCVRCIPPRAPGARRPRGRGRRAQTRTCRTPRGGQRGARGAQACWARGAARQTRVGAGSTW
jgi:hypothetical protein